MKKHLIKQLFDSHKRFIGCLMRMEGNDIVIAINNIGEFCARFDGQNTYLLPNNEFHSLGNNLYEIVLLKFNENKVVEGSIY